MRPFGFAIVLVCVSSFAFAQDIDLTLRGKQIILHVDVTLTSSQKRALKKFKRKADFYAAIAVNQSDLSEDAMGAVWNVNTLKAAQNMALRSCQVKTKQPNQCILFASLIPENKPKKSTKITLTPAAIDSFRRFLRARSLIQYGAFVANDNWAWGRAMNHSTQKLAETNALALCERSVAKAGMSQSAKWRKAVIDRSENRCRLIYVTKPY